MSLVPSYLNGNLVESSYFIISYKYLFLLLLFFFKIRVGILFYLFVWQLFMQTNSEKNNEFIKVVVLLSLFWIFLLVFLCSHFNSHRNVNVLLHVSSLQKLCQLLWKHLWNVWSRYICYEFELWLKRLKTTLINKMM